MKVIIPLALAIALLPIAPAGADVLLLDAIQATPANEPAGLQRPVRGMSMDRVRAKFGNPGNELAPVGEPPITRWVYPDFTVYFEHQFVIETVVHR